MSPCLVVVFLVMVAVVVTVVFTSLLTCFPIIVTVILLFGGHWCGCHFHHCGLYHLFLPSHWCLFCHQEQPPPDLAVEVTHFCGPPTNASASPLWLWMYSWEEYVPLLRGLWLWDMLPRQCVFLCVAALLLPVGIVRVRKQNTRHTVARNKVQICHRMILRFWSNLLRLVKVEDIFIVQKLDVFFDVYIKFAT